MAPVQVLVEPHVEELADVCVALVEGETPEVHAGSSDDSTNGSLPCMADDGIGDTGLPVQVTVTSTGTLETGSWSRDVQIDIDAVARHEEMWAWDAD